MLISLNASSLNINNKNKILRNRKIPLITVMNAIPIISYEANLSLFCCIEAIMDNPITAFRKVNTIDVIPIISPFDKLPLNEKSISFLLFLVYWHLISASKTCISISRQGSSLVIAMLNVRANEKIIKNLEEIFI